jgi:hypothetical protein
LFSVSSSGTCAAFLQLAFINLQSFKGIFLTYILNDSI